MLACCVPDAYHLTHASADISCSYWCMPQGERSLAESVEFKHMLKHANLLYLGTRVLILLDLSYIGRFWTLFEAWLSMQAVHPEGLTPATREQQRFDIVPIHGANKITGESLKNMWAERTPEEAYDLLKKPDVTVTNHGDKEIQLDKLLQLDEEVRDAVRATGMPETNADKCAIDVKGHSKGGTLWEKKPSIESDEVPPRAPISQRAEGSSSMSGGKQAGDDLKRLRIRVETLERRLEASERQLMARVDRLERSKGNKGVLASNVFSISRGLRSTKVKTGDELPPGLPSPPPPGVVHV